MTKIIKLSIGYTKNCKNNFIIDIVGKLSPFKDY